MSQTHEVHAHGHPHDTAGHPHHPAGHSHQAPLAAESYSARKHPEFIVLEIGDGVGALIVHADPEMHGREVEISVTGEDDRRSHKEVLERSINGRAAFTAVFDQLTAGTYTLWTGGEARAREVAVPSGAIAQLDWRAAAGAM